MFPASQSSRGDHDIIDSLDHSAYYMYHHEGPFDAASRARNKVSDGGPLEALAGQHNVSPKPPRRDNNPDNRFAKQFHLPPGTVDREGRVHDDDDDGSNMMYDIMKHPGYVSLFFPFLT